MKTFFLSITIVFFSTLVCANDNQTKTVDKIFAAWDKANDPGAAVGIFQNGETIFARGYGMANVEHGIPNNMDSVFRIASTSKQFTAACIILLAQQNILSLDETLHSVFPAFPDYAKNITIRHLLNHTSGIRDYLTLASLKGLSDSDVYSDRDIMQWLIRQSELNFMPGEEHLYSNSGYWLLGQIVNEKAGMSMVKFAEQSIFRPLGMNNTHFHDDHTKIVKHRASGYGPAANDAFAISMTNLEMIGDGGIFTSINDMKKWDDAFYKSTTLDSAFWEEMTRQGILNNGSVIEYASGLMISEYQGLKTISHGGAFAGFRAEFLRFPNQNFAIAIFANRADAQPWNMAFDIAEVFLKDDFKLASESISIPDSVAVKQEAKAPLDQLVGDYSLRPELKLRVSVKGDKLHGEQLWNDNEYELLLTKGTTNTYQIANDEIIKFTFTNFDNNKAQSINLLQNGQVSDWKRVAVFDASVVDLTEFLGDYYSEELDVTYQLRLHDKNITVQVAKAPLVTTKVANIDKLFHQGNTIELERAEGSVVGFRLEAGRVKNVKFIKH
jgi:CubicO group peptidase (beta-lactamase class C family)